MPRLIRPLLPSRPCSNSCPAATVLGAKHFKKQVWLPGYDAGTYPGVAKMRYRFVRPSSSTATSSCSFSTSIAFLMAGMLFPANSAMSSNESFDTSESE